MSRLVDNKDEEEVVEQYDPIKDLKSDIESLKGQMEFVETTQSTTFMNLDSTVKSTLKEGFKKLKKEMDRNNDGKITFDEGMHWLRKITDSGGFKLIMVSIISFIIMQLISATVSWIELGIFNVGVFNTIGDAVMGILFSYVTNSIKQRNDESYARLLNDHMKLREKQYIDKVEHINDLHNKDIVIAARDTEICYLNNRIKEIEKKD